MPDKRLLITGGAGFIGSHLADELLAQGYEVRVLDNVTSRVHGSTERPTYLDPGVDLIVGDIRDGAVVERALEGVEGVFHFAAAVGSGESIFEVERCMSVNNVGTAVLMDRLTRSGVSRLVLASSMSVYGEGLYRDRSGTATDVGRRSPAQLRCGEWEPTLDGVLLTPIATPETKALDVGSAYPRSKFDQERMCRQFGRTFGVPTVALRFFNVFGARQTASNPYTGDLANIAAQLLRGVRPSLLEDGLQTRDLISARDVAVACRLAFESSTAREGVINVASGQTHTLAEVVRRMATIVGRPQLTPEFTGKFQIGDVRHCRADVQRAERLLGWRATTTLDAGLAELVDWVASKACSTSMRPVKRLAKATPFRVREVQFGMGVAS